MGNSNSSTTIAPLHITETGISLYYLHRKERFVLYLTQKTTKKYRFKNKIKLYQDSALGYLNESSVMITGGTNSKGRLTSYAYLVDFEK